MKMPMLVLICATFLFGCASNGGSSAQSTPAPNAAAGTNAVASQDAADDAAAKAPAAEKPRLVCKREKPIGSNRVVRTCRTREEWRDITKRTQSGMAREMGQGGGCQSCGADGP